MDDSVTWTIAQLTDWLDVVVAQSLGGEIWVEGEITNLNRSSIGHVYFTLVEHGGRAPAPSLNVVLFDWHRANVNGRLKRAGGAVRMADGVRVRIRGDVKLYPARSQYQLRMTSIDPAFTLGSLAVERAALLARLEVEGLLSANRTLPEPMVPLRVALITSVGSAAHADALAELEASGFGFEIGVVDARVQGAEAATELVRALATAVAWRPDLIALVRGGGARTDLAAFDAEPLARAIATCPVPVWCGLGHETDRAVADEVAHRSWKTPTACADAIVELVTHARNATEALWQDTTIAARRHVDRAAHGLAQRTGMVALRAGRGTERAERRVAALANRVSARTETHLVDADRHLVAAVSAVREATTRRLAGAGRSLDDHALLVRAHDPARTLARGWSLTRTEDGRLVRAPGDAPPGTALITQVSGGELHSTVDEP